MKRARGMRYIGEIRVRRLSLAITFTVAAILIVLSAATPAQDIDWKKGKLGHLIKLLSGPTTTTPFSTTHRSSRP
jgi:hypothetical protein